MSILYLIIPEFRVLYFLNMKAISLYSEIIFLILSESEDQISL
jgi:hypothetical protein